MARAKKHHQVPQFYLSAFADQAGKIRVFDRLTQKEFTRHIREVASESNLYTVRDSGGEPSDEVEQAIAQFEGAAAGHLSAFLSPILQVSEEDRYVVSVLMALQFLRTSEQRRQIEDVLDTVTRLEVESNVGGGPPERVEEFIRKRYPDTDEAFKNRVRTVAANPELPFTMTNEEWLHTVMPMARDVAPILLARRWRMAVASKKSFVTSDSPVVLIGSPGDLPGVGIGTARAILFPVSTYRLLVLENHAPTSTSVDDFEPERAYVRWANQCIANASTRQVLCHPHSKFGPLDGLNLSPRGKTRWINGKTVESNERSYDKIRDEWIPNMHRIREEIRREASKIETATSLVENGIAEND